MINKIILIGRNTRDLELNKTASGKSTCKFSLAVDRPMKQGEEKSSFFIDVVCWNGLAENCAKYLKKGRKCCVAGKLDIRPYQAKDGTNRMAVEIEASDVEFLDGENTNGNNEQPKPTQKQPAEVTSIFEQIDESSLPF